MRIVAILKFCVVGFSRKPCMIAYLAREFRVVGIEGLSVMQIAGSLSLLMFDDDMNRRRVMESNCLDKWIERIEVWTSSMVLPNQRAWLSVSEMACSTKDTVVPNSVHSKRTIKKMWEGNVSVDWRVMGTSSWMAEENLGMEQRVENGDVDI
ncbi:hypothetical protein V6N13_025512 [Hibiscus sabdariffa]